MSAKSPIPEAEELREVCFRQICESDTFRTAPTMRNLLIYLWSKRDRPMSEYAIGLDVLGRPPDFDSKTDASVRVAIARLRGKLREFYEHSDSAFPLRMTIPLGSHELKWTCEGGPPKPPETPSDANPWYRWMVGAGVALILLLASICLYFYSENRALRTSTPAPPAPLARFWRSFLGGGKPVVVIVPNPLYLVWPNRIYTRDLKIGRFADWPNSPFFEDMAKRYGQPSPSQTYVGAVEVLAATRVVQYLERGGQQVELVDSARFSADSFANQNTISLGMPRTAAYLDKLLERTNFYLAQVEPDLVKSRNPRPGELSEFREQRLSPEHAIHPGVIICLPRRPEQSRSLLLIGEYPNGITPMLISVEGLKQLDEQWIKNGSPEGWEMVVKAEIFRDTALKVWPVAFRPIPDDFWK